MSAQYGPPAGTGGVRYRPNPISTNGNDGNDGNEGGNTANDQFSNNSGTRAGPSQSFLDARQNILLAHAILACLAFVVFFPVGSILIRLGSFRGVWLVHGLFQIFAYLVYVAAFGIGVWMVNNIPANLLASHHPIIGMVVLGLLFFQPILGFIHHLKFKKYSRRTFWSYAHLWLGRAAITLGMINGGLGLLLASDAPAFTGFTPSETHIIAYSAVAGFMWLMWVTAAIVGERRRERGLRQRAAKETETDHSSDSGYSPHRSHFASTYVSELGSYELRRDKERYQ